MRITPIFLLALYAAQAHATSDTSPPQKVIVNGAHTDTEAGRDAVAGKIVIGKQRIADSGLQNVGELLRREPAITIGKDGRMGLLGLPGYTQVLVDGLPPQGDPFALDLAHIEGIEILKSTMAATGPVGIAGTINIIRRKAERKSSSQGSVGASSSAGRTGANVSWNSNQAVAESPFVYNMSMSARRTRAPRSSHYRETRAAEDIASELEFDGDAEAVNVFDAVFASGELAWTLDAANTIRFRPDIGRIRISDEGSERRQWQDGRVLSIRQGSVETLDSWSLPLTWRRQFGADSALSLRLNVNRPRMRIDAPRLEERSGAQAHRRRHAEQRDATNYFVDLDIETVLRGGHALGAGARLVRNDSATAYGDLSDGVQDLGLAVLGRASSTLVNGGRLFLQDEWRIDRSLSANVGLAVERRVYTLDEGPLHNRADFNMWSPSVHLSRKIGGDRKRQLRFSLARSFQPPAAERMLLHPTINAFAPCLPDRLCGANAIDTADSSGNPGLRPERALGLNLSYAHGFGRDSELLVEWYARDIRDKTGVDYALAQVAWASAPRHVVRPVNLGQARVRGVNLEGRLAGKDIAPALAALEVHGSLGFAHSALSDLSGPDSRIADQSPWRVKLGGSHALQAVPLKLGFEASVLPADWVRDSASRRIYQSGTRTLGVNGSWKIDAKSKLTFNLDNLLHRPTARIDEYRSGPELLRWWTGSAGHARFSLKFDTVL